MRRLLLDLPLFVLLLAVAALAMLVPAGFAATVGEHQEMRAFFYSAVLLGTVSGFAAIATHGRPVRRQGRTHLITLLATYLVIPVVLAVPVVEAVRDTSFMNAWFEMVSALTTTGATVFEDPERLGRSVHLWRALVGWLGGFLAWVTAIAIMAPLNLGGFEVLNPAPVGGGNRVFGTTASALPGDTPSAAERLMHFTTRLLPVYTGLTAVLWVALTVLGETPFVAFCHAMSTMATSGISPVGGLSGASGVIGEGLVFLFLLFALSRQTFTTDARGDDTEALRTDPEFRLGLLIVLVVPVLIFLHHWVGVLDLPEGAERPGGLAAFWGGLFTTMSFLTTAGFESAYWDAAQLWSGLETPGLMLLGLSIFGGGVATTAGGVKLLRVYALYRHGQRELDKLVFPNSVAGAGVRDRHFRRQGAYVAWVFFMLFAMSIAMVMAMLGFFHLSFEEVTVLTVAALSTTGPLASVAADTPLSYAALPAGAKAILAGTMVLGRLEMLVIVALINPLNWRQ